MRNTPQKVIGAYFKSSLEGKRKTGEVPTTPIAMLSKTGHTPDREAIAILRKQAAEMGMRVLYSLELNKTEEGAIDPEKDVVVIRIGDSVSPLEDIRADMRQLASGSDGRSVMGKALKAAHISFVIEASSPGVLDELDEIQDIFPDATIITFADPNPSLEGEYLKKLNEKSIPTVRFSQDLEQFLESMERIYPEAVKAGALDPLKINPDLFDSQPSQNGNSINFKAGYSPARWRRFLLGVESDISANPSTPLADIPGFMREAQLLLGQEALSIYSMDAEQRKELIDKASPLISRGTGLDDFIGKMERHYPAAANMGILDVLRNNPEIFYGIGVPSSPPDISPTPRAWAELIRETNRKLTSGEASTLDQVSGFGSMAKALLGSEAGNRLLDGLGFEGKPQKIKLDVAGFLKSVGLDSSALDGGKSNPQKPSA